MIYAMLILVAIIAVMLGTTTLIPTDFIIVGFIASGIMIGFSYSISKNIFFPITIVTGYNLIVIFTRIGEIDSVSIIDTIIKSLFDSLYIVFIVIWVVVFLQYIESYLKKQKEEKDQSKPTITKFLVGSIIAGTLYGLMMVIQII